MVRILLALTAVALFLPACDQSDPATTTTTTRVTATTSTRAALAADQQELLEACQSYRRGEGVDAILAIVEKEGGADLSSSGTAPKAVQDYFRMRAEDVGEQCPK